jgi:poly-gamma-glutamate synthesis protein (capsule biosynthesis protein)
MGNNDETIRLYAVGDVAAFNKNPESAFEYVGDTLQEADISFAQNERHYNRNHDLIPLRNFTELTYPENAEALKAGGFDVISFASNHTMDLGTDVMIETINILKKLGFVVIGAGQDISEARKPAIFERKGTKIGFLAYCSVMRPGCDATAWRGGVAPMRAWTLYEQVDYQPGTPPRIVTLPNKDDLKALEEDINRLRPKVDVLAVSMHWGVHLFPAVIADYQTEVAHTAIDAGADIILGHHPHILKGIEVYKGKPIIYSMGNFALDPCEQVPQFREQYPDIDTFLLLYTATPKTELRYSMIVKCIISNKAIQAVSFLPVLINEKSQPQIIHRNESAFNEIFEYMKCISQSQKLDTKFNIDGDEIVVTLT